MASLTPEQVSDRIEIGDLLTRYTVAIDQKNWDLLDTVYTADAWIDYTTSGGIKGNYPEIRTWLEKALSAFDMTMHFISNSTVELDGDKASARTYVINPMGVRQEDDSLHIFTVGAYYIDKLVRTAEGWRIAERFEEQAYFEGSFPKNLQIPS